MNFFASAGFLYGVPAAMQNVHLPLQPFNNLIFNKL